MKNNINRLLSLCLVVGSALSLPGCGNGDVRVRNSNPWTGDTEVEYRKAGYPTHALPEDWTIDGEYHYDIKIDGIRYTVRLCIARNTRVPHCLYIKNGGCGNSDGWEKYCRSLSAPTTQNRPPSGSIDAVSVAVDSALVAMADAEIVPEEDLSPCPDERGSVDYDPLTGVTSFSFTTACGDEQIPSDLVDVVITSPDGVTLPSDEFSLLYGGILPAGATVSISGNDEVVTWNCYKFGRTELAFTSTDGHLVHAAITTEPRTGLPIAMVALDGEIRRVMPVTRPQ